MRLQQYHEETEEDLKLEAKHAESSEHARFATDATVPFATVTDLRVVVAAGRLGVAPTVVVTAVEVLAVVTILEGGEGRHALACDGRALQRR